MNNGVLAWGDAHIQENDDPVSIFSGQPHNPRVATRKEKIFWSNLVKIGQNWSKLQPGIVDVAVFGMLLRTWSGWVLARSELAILFGEIGKNFGERCGP